MFEMQKPACNMSPPWLVNTVTIGALLVGATVMLNPHQRHPHPTLLSFVSGSAGVLAVLIAYSPYGKNPTFRNQRRLIMTANAVILLASILRNRLIA